MLQLSQLILFFFYSPRDTLNLWYIVLVSFTIELFFGICLIFLCLLVFYIYIYFAAFAYIHQIMYALWLKLLYIAHNSIVGCCIYTQMWQMGRRFNVTLLFFLLFDCN